MNLFYSQDQPKLLDQFKKEKFHSMVAKLLYVANRTRPDVLLPINHLCTRVSRPSDEDHDKLIRVLKYLNKKKDMMLELGMNVAL